MTAVGLANPVGALALVALAALVALWMRDRRRRSVPVATLLLWRRVPAAPLGRRRLPAEPLFLVQAAMLLALVLGLLGPWVEHGGGTRAGGRLLIVLDRSASMQAREVRGTRFELARRRARELIEGLGGDDEVMILGVAASSRVVLPWTADHRRAEAHLETVDPLDTPTSLTPALTLALAEQRERPETHVAVLTDLPRTASGLASAALATLDWHEIGRTDDNVAIAGLHVERPPFAPLSATRASALVRNYDAAPREAALEARVAGERWAVRRVRLAPRATEIVQLTAPPAPGALELTLEASDALPLDDRAWGWVPDAAPLSALVVSDLPGLAIDLARLTRAFEGAVVTATTPAEYEIAAPVARVVVSHAYVPRDLQAAVGLLLIDPPPGNGICPSGPRVPGATLVDWSTAHPATHGLDAAEALVLRNLRRLHLPRWGKALATVATAEDTFALLVAGERHGRRTACLGIAPRGRLATSDGLPMVLLTLGTVAWLGQAPSHGTMVETGVPLSAPAGTPTGRWPAGLRVVGVPPVLVAERVGHYQQRGVLDGPAVAANLFDDAESDIGRRPGTPQPAHHARLGRGAPVAGHRTELGWWLHLTGVALLAIEWALWRRRTRP